MNKIVIIGSGCREYTIINKLRNELKESGIKKEIICFKNQDNGMIDLLVDKSFNYDGITDNKTAFTVFINMYKDEIDFVMVGAENPLANGIIDYLNMFNINCIGPNKFYTQLESSKIFCRNFLKTYNLDVYSPQYIQIKYCDNVLDLNSDEKEYIYINEFKYLEVEDIRQIETTLSHCEGVDLNIRKKFELFYNKISNRFEGFVIKKDFLCGGKGVTVEGVDFTDRKSAIFKEVVGSYQLKYDFLIEQKLVGQEFSLTSFTDGYNFVHCPPVQDFKRLLDGDKGPNTGGMGCICYENNTLPFLVKDDINMAEQINESVIKKLNNYGIDCGNKDTYTGILYGSYMKTNDGEIKIIEYNCRLGDPETMIIMNLLNSSLYNLFSLLVSNSLDLYKVKFNQNAAMCLYYVPSEYPNVYNGTNKYKNYYDIYCKKLDEDIEVAYGNCVKEGSHLYSAKSRTMALTTNQLSFYQAYHKLYSNSDNICGNLYFRNDIGDKYLSKYQKSGVSIDNAENSLKKIKNNILNTYNSHVISEFGSFGGEYKLDNNVLVASIDGVGSKSIASNRIYGIDGFRMLGQDIVGHSINDILVQGAKPLFFLDYFGTATLNSLELEHFIDGVSQTCIDYGNIPILGGETAEMPLVYKPNESDLVGCIIGVKDNKFFNVPMKHGDLIINLPSVGPHTNGFTLINNLIQEDMPSEDVSLLKSLLNPHKCYLNEVYGFIKEFGYDNIHGMCHVTGGGFYQNMERVLPEGLSIELNNKIVFPLWATILQNKLNIDTEEMMKVYNCGLGFILIIDNSIRESLIRLNCDFEIIGSLINK